MVGSGGGARAVMGSMPGQVPDDDYDDDYVPLDDGVVGTDHGNSSGYRLQAPASAYASDNADGAGSSMGTARDSDDWPLALKQYDLADYRERTKAAMRRNLLKLIPAFVAISLLVAFVPGANALLAALSGNLDDVMDDGSSAFAPAGASMIPVMLVAFAVVMGLMYLGVVLRTRKMADSPGMTGLSEIRLEDVSKEYPRIRSLYSMGDARSGIGYNILDGVDARYSRTAVRGVLLAPPKDGRTHSYRLYSDPSCLGGNHFLGSLTADVAHRLVPLWLDVRCDGSARIRFDDGAAATTDTPMDGHMSVTCVDGLVYVETGGERGARPAAVADGRGVMPPAGANGTAVNAAALPTQAAAPAARASETPAARAAKGPGIALAVFVAIYLVSKLLLSVSTANASNGTFSAADIGILFICSILAVVAEIGGFVSLVMFIVRMARSRRAAEEANRQTDPAYGAGVPAAGAPGATHAGSLPGYGYGTAGRPQAPAMGHRTAEPAFHAGQPTYAPVQAGPVAPAPMHRPAPVYGHGVAAGQAPRPQVVYAPGPDGRPRPQVAYGASAPVNGAAYGHQPSGYHGVPGRAPVPPYAGQAPVRQPAQRPVNGSPHAGPSQTGPDDAYDGGETGVW